MFKNSSAKYHQDNKERLQKKARLRLESISKEQGKSNSMVVNAKKIYQNMKNKTKLSVEKML